MRLADPWFLLLLGLLPLLWWWEHRRGVPSATLQFSNTDALRGLAPSLSVRCRRRLPIVRMVILASLIIGLARPQAGQSEYEILTEGVDIVLVLDISSSMRAEDFKPQNRLGAAKEAALEFIRRREHDRVGLVVFARYALTQCPMTLDYGVLEQLLEQIDIGMIEDGTAVGTAIALAAKRLEHSSAASKVIILLTDGENNAGEIDPVTAAKAAAAFDIKVYTIGAGRPGSALYPIDDPIFGRRYVRMPTRLDEKSLRQIAQVTGGEYFRAKDTKGLVSIYQQIDRLEKTEIESVEYIDYEERVEWVLWPVLALLLLELVVTRTWLVQVP